MTSVAFLTPYLPWPADTGGKLRSYYLLRSLAHHADVDLYTVHDEPVTPDPGPLQDIVRRVEAVRLYRSYGGWNVLSSLMSPAPRSVRFFHTGQSMRCVRPRLSAGYDLFVCDEIVMAPYCEPGPDIPAVPRLIMRQKVDHAHYAEMAASRPWGHEKVLDWLEARRLLRYERTTMPAFDAAVVCSEADLAAVRPYMNRSAPVEVLVNGADTDYFRPQREPDPHPTLLLLGTMHYYPNIDATLYFFAEMYPRLRQAIPDLQVLVVGHLPPEEILALGKDPAVTVTGSVPDVRPYMARSWAMLVPLRLGGGTRLKIMEAMASGLPVVSTGVGAEGTRAVDGEQLLLADSPAAFVEATLSVLGDEGLRTHLAANGLNFVRAYYSWQTLGARFADFCLDVARRTPTDIRREQKETVPWQQAG